MMFNMVDNPIARKCIIRDLKMLNPTLGVQHDVNIINTNSDVTFHLQTTFLKHMLHLTLKLSLETPAS